MLHFMTYEFRHEFMYMINIVKSYMKSWVPRFKIMMKEMINFMLTYPLHKFAYFGNIMLIM